MPKENKQPFTGDQLRNPNDTQLVDQVLGRKAAVEMEELIGQDKPPKTESTSLNLSEDELGAVGEAEKTETEKRRDEYVIWAEKIKKNEDWVDETFIFESDGKVRVEGDLNLSNTKILELPPALYKVEGLLNLSSNQITSLKNMPDTVGGFFLNSDQITSLKGLPNTIGGDLILPNIPATSIPEGLAITGKIFLMENQTELIADCQAKGYTVVVN